MARRDERHRRLHPQQGTEGRYLHRRRQERLRLLLPDRPAAPGTGSEGHYDQDMLQFSKWGFDFVEVDWCGGDAEGLDAATTYKAISSAVAKASASTGRPLTLSVCNRGKQNPWNWAPGLGPMWRTGTDIVY